MSPFGYGSPLPVSKQVAAFNVTYSTSFLNTLFSYFKRFMNLFSYLTVFYNNVYS